MWTLLVDTAAQEPGAVDNSSVELPPYSLMLLRYGRERRVAGARGRSSGGAVATTVVESG
jgi:hypothetical protein